MIQFFFMSKPMVVNLRNCIFVGGVQTVMLQFKVWLTISNNTNINPCGYFVVGSLFKLANAKPIDNKRYVLWALYMYVYANSTIIFTSHSFLINTYYGTDEILKKNRFYDHSIHATMVYYCPLCNICYRRVHLFGLCKIKNFFFCIFCNISLRLELLKLYLKNYN